MTIDELDDRIRRLSRAVQDQAETLLELELDPTRELLEKSTLTGATASAWAAVSAGLAQAWEAQTLLEGHLEQVRSLRGSRGRLGGDRMRELEELVEGLALRVPSEPGARCSALQLLERCASAVAAARELLGSVSQAWDTLVPRLSTANATLRACGDLLEQIGAPPGPRLTEVRRELAQLTAAVAGDPLAASPKPVAALEAKVAGVRTDAERLRDLRAASAARLEEARALLAEARAAGEEAQEAHRVAVAKIASTDLPRPAELPADAADELERIGALIESGAWSDADEALQRWRARVSRARDEARSAAAANRAPIALRDELRGRLGAYQAKAQRLRLLEDPALAALYERAHRILHTAPTDLEEAGDILRRYQEGLSKTPEREVLQ